MSKHADPIVQEVFEILGDLTLNLEWCERQYLKYDQMKPNFTYDDAKQAYARAAFHFLKVSFHQITTVTGEKSFL